MISLHWRQSQRWMVRTQPPRKWDVCSLWVLVSLFELLHLRKLRKPTSASRLERLPLESLSEVQLTRFSSGFYEAQSLGYTGNLLSIPLERCLPVWLTMFSDPSTTSDPLHQHHWWKQEKVFQDFLFSSRQAISIYMLIGDTATGAANGLHSLGLLKARHMHPKQLRACVGFSGMRHIKNSFVPLLYWCRVWIAKLRAKAKAIAVHILQLQSQRHPQKPSPSKRQKMMPRSNLDSVSSCSAKWHTGKQDPHECLWL